MEEVQDSSLDWVNCYRSRALPKVSPESRWRTSGQSEQLSPDALLPVWRGRFRSAQCALLARRRSSSDHPADLAVARSPALQASFAGTSSARDSCVRSGSDLASCKRTHAPGHRLTIALPDTPGRASARGRSRVRIGHCSGRRIAIVFFARRSIFLQVCMVQDPTP